MLLIYVRLHICSLLIKKKKAKQEAQETSSRQTALMRLLTEANALHLFNDRSRVFEVLIWIILCAQLR